MATRSHEMERPAANEVLLITSGDLRLSANQTCWPAQRDMEEKLTAAFAQKGFKLVRAHAYNEKEKHGFISSQRMGMDVFMKIHPEAKLVFATAAWQYSHHVLPGLRSHRGPILTVANWSGQWPGLVGMLNLNGSLVKAGSEVLHRSGARISPTSSFSTGLREWLRDGRITHDLSARACARRERKLPAEAASWAPRWPATLQRRKAIMGIFDEGCMGMYNAIIDDELLNPLGVYKERLSQSALVARDAHGRRRRGRGVYRWLDDESGMQVRHRPERGDRPDRLAQILEQCKMYIAAVRIADEFGCDAIGIQYQQGLKDMAPASDLAEGLLNNADRPPVSRADDGSELYAGQPLPHFNEVDECAGLDALMTNRVLEGAGPRSVDHAARRALGRALHGRGHRRFRVGVPDFRRGAGQSHFVGGYAGASQRAAAGHVLPAGRRLAEGRRQAGRDCLEPRLRGGRSAACGYGAWNGGEPAGGGDRAALERDDAAVADHARDLAWGEPRTSSWRGTAPTTRMWRMRLRRRWRTRRSRPRRRCWPSWAWPCTCAA